MNPIKILVAEDDASLRQGLVDLLEDEGYQALAAADGETALHLYAEQHPNLLLLDVMMPGRSGFEVCRKVRQGDSVTPIILLTAKGEEIDKVVGLELGADDYVTKPFGLHELRARIAAVLRRSNRNGTRPSDELPEQFPIGECRINRKTYECTRGAESFSLTARELKLLEAFFTRPNEVLSRNDLLNAAWGVDYFGTTRTLDQHVAQLRKKIETDPSAPQLLLTVHGVGYKLKVD